MLYEYSMHGNAEFIITHMISSKFTRRIDITVMFLH